MEIGSRTPKKPPEQSPEHQGVQTQPRPAKRARSLAADADAHQDFGPDASAHEAAKDPSRQSKLKHPRARSPGLLPQRNQAAGAPPVPEQLSDVAPSTFPPTLQQLLVRAGKKQHKVRLDGAEVRIALGEERHERMLAAWGTIQQSVVQSEGGVRLAQRPFRASVLSGSSTMPPFIVGPPRAQGAFGKVRDALFVLQGGKGRLEIVLKEFRKSAPRPDYDAAGFDRKPQRPTRTGLPRTKVSKSHNIREEYRSALKHGGPFPCYGVVAADDKLYIALGRAHADLFTVLEHAKRGEHSALARHTGERYAQHLAEIHRKGDVHCDGKLKNLALDLNDGSVGITDFGGVLAVDPKLNHVSEPIRAITFLSPETVMTRTVGFGQDVWCMGLALVKLLDCHGPLIDLGAKSDRPTCERRLKRFEKFRTSLLDSQGNIDLAKLTAASGDPLHEILAPAIENDPELTAYILGHLLNPDPALRATAVAAEVVLRRLAEAPYVNSTMQERVLPRSKQRLSHLEVAPQKLHAVMDILLEADPNVFAVPT